MPRLAGPRQPSIPACADRPVHAVIGDRRGSVGIIFALTIVTIFGLLACAIDLGRAVSVRTTLLAAADNANFAAIGASTEGFSAAMAQTSDGPVPLAQADAAQFFDAQTASMQQVAGVQRTVSVTKTNGLVRSEISFTASIKTAFASVIGVPTVDISATSAASNGIPVFMDFYLLLDDSPSMGVAATTSDITTMVANTPDQCAFACHDLSDPNNYYDLAKRLGVTTRIDVLRQATQSLFTTATRVRANPQQFGMAINTFDVALTSLSAVTRDMTAASDAAAAIDLFPVPRQGWNNDQITNFDVAMQGMNLAMPAPGTGASSSSRQEVLFLVTDGVADFDLNGERTIEPIDTSLCDTIKARGIKIAVLYTPYLPLPTNGFYMANVAPFQANIGPTMQRCASPGMYFAVAPDQGISEAMNALFLKVIGMAHLTQ